MLIVGWVLTGLVVLAFGGSMTWKTCEVIPCISKWEYLQIAPPNEVGDTLAGFAGTLAFVWIIVTVLLQSAELRAQREELKLTRYEFSKMAEAQAEQVRALQAQADIFTDEKESRDAEQARILANELIEQFVRFVSSNIKNFPRLIIVFKHRSSRLRTGQSSIQERKEIRWLDVKRSEEGFERYFRRMSFQIGRSVDELDKIEFVNFFVVLSQICMINSSDWLTRLLN